jgi:hypothetical protein
VADRSTVTLRHKVTGEEIRRPKTSAPFFVTQGFEVLDSAGRVNSKATSAATTKKESN